MLTSRLDAYISRYGDFCANDNDNDTTDYLTPYACARGNKYAAFNYPIKESFPMRLVVYWQNGNDVFLRMITHARTYYAEYAIISYMSAYLSVYRDLPRTE